MLLFKIIDIFAGVNGLAPLILGESFKFLKIKIKN